MWTLPRYAKAKGESRTTEHTHSRHRHKHLDYVHLVLVMRTHRYMWSLDKIGCIAKSSQQSFCHWRQNKHYQLANLQNHITTNMFDVVRIITSKQQIFSVRSSPDPTIFKKIAVRSSSWSGQNWLQSWSSPIQSCPCSSLVPSLFQIRFFACIHTVAPMQQRFLGGPFVFGNSTSWMFW